MEISLTDLNCEHVRINKKEKQRTAATTNPLLFNFSPLISHMNGTAAAAAAAAAVTPHV